MIADGTPKSVPPSPATVSTISSSMRAPGGPGRPPRRRPRSAAPPPAAPPARDPASLPLRHQPGQSSAQAKAFFVPRSTPISSRRVAVMPLPYRHGHHRCPHPHVHAALARVAARVGRPVPRRRPARRPRGDLPRRDAGRASRSRATSTTACGSRRWTRPGIDVSVVSLTCPNVYWGGEAVSVERRARGERLDGRGAARLPGPHPLVRVAAVAVPGARGRGARPELRRGRGRRDGPRQHRRPEPDRGRVRADLGRDRPARAAGPGASRASRPART